MAQVVWTATAKRNLATLNQFIAQDSEKYAFIVALEIVSHARDLETHPLKGKIVPEFNNPEIREIRVYSYRVIYKIITMAKLAIVRIWHKSRLLKKL